MKQYLFGIAAVAAFAVGGVVQATPVQNAPDQVPQSVGHAQLSPTQRSAIIGGIVRTWGPFVQAVYKTSPDIWVRRMASTFSAASDTNLERAAAMKTFQGMVSALVGSRVSDAKVIDSLATRAEVLNSGPIPALLGDATDDLVYTPIAPCRIVDTRNIGGPIAAGSTRSFIGYTSTNFSSQGGISNSNCGIPANPSALVINVTGVSPVQAGYLTVYPFGTTKPLASSLNYGIGGVAGNEILAGMTIGSATDQFSVFSSGTTQVVVDAVGYFMAPQATALDTTTVTASQAIPNGMDATVAVPACPATYALVGSYCDGAEDVPGAYLLGIGAHECEFRNNSGNSVTFSAVSQCARVPGR